MALHEVNIDEIPDSYRKDYSVYPRSWYPAQMQLSPSSRAPKGRFITDRDDDHDEDNDIPPTATTTVTAPMLDGREGDLKVPASGRNTRRKEEQLNDLGYRISWSQSRTFNGRIIFLQQSLDVYRGRMKDQMVGGGKEVKTIPPVYETRTGKRKWIEHKARGKGKGDRGGE